MKANELMVGDWVEVPFFECKPKIVKVEEILSDEINPMWDGMENYGGVKIKYVNPISLTPEILEKNGFEYKEPILTTFSEEKVWQIEDSNKQILIEIEEQTDDNLVDYYVGRFICGCNNCELFIKYIHELQHALKLCGIEKTIEL